MSIDSVFNASLKRRTGWREGAQSAVFAQPPALDIHHVAFQRGALFSIELRRAFEDYLASSQTHSDLRYVQHRQTERVKEILQAGARLDATQLP